MITEHGAELLNPAGREELPLRLCYSLRPLFVKEYIYITATHANVDLAKGGYAPKWTVMRSSSPSQTEA